MLKNFCKSPPQMKLTGHVSLFHSNFSPPLTHQHHKTLPLLLLASFTSPFQFALFSYILPSSYLYSKYLINQCKSSNSLTLTLFNLFTLPFFLFFIFRFHFYLLQFIFIYFMVDDFFFFAFYLLSPHHH